MEIPNLNYINALAGDSNDFKLKIISVLKKELPTEVASYHKQIKNKNYLIAAGCVHKLKHKISVLGLEKSYYLAELFENNLKENSTNLQIDFEKILKTMELFVEEL